MEAWIEFPPLENSQGRGPVSNEETDPLARGMVMRWTWREKEAEELWEKRLADVIFKYLFKIMFQISFKK